MRIVQFVQFLIFLLSICFVFVETRTFRGVKDAPSKETIARDKFGFQPTCLACTAAVSVFSVLLHFNFSETVILEMATAICAMFSKESWAVCGGITDQFRDEFLYVFRQLAKENPSQICGILLQDCDDPTDPSQSGWLVDLPPKMKKLRTFRQKTTPKAPSPEKLLRVLQLSDLHIDFSYKYGSEAECSDPVCCQNHVENPVKPAGYWGTAAKCDTPLRTVAHMLDHIQTEHQVDMVIMTGDYVNHVDWHYSVDEHLSVLRRLHKTVKDAFDATPVYWSVGNHEGVPVNSFAPHTVDSRFWPTWLYRQLKVMNEPWLSDEANRGLLHRGSYATKVIDRLKLISLNTGFCENTNFFLYLNQSDPDSTMSWFVNELYESEKKGERVFVAAHIPPGDSECLEGWAYNYYRVIQRFASTISAQFFGHDHLDFFTVFYEDMHNVSSTPISVAYAAPSVTTFEYQNPGYRIYYVDPEDDYSIVDYEAYYADLSKATRDIEPQWKKLYSAKKDYKLNDLSPRSWNQLAHKIFKSKTMQKKFMQTAFRHDNPACDSTCLNQLLCNLRMGHHNATLYCPSDLI